MISQEKIEKIVTWTGLKEFGAFALSHCAAGHLPDYEKMDLMKIPRLVPYIFVLDLRDFATTDQLLINFAGEKLTEVHGKNIMGVNAFSIYKKDKFYFLVGQHDC